MVIQTHNKEHSRGRVGLFLCECGCGQEFFAEYKTRQPKYYNKTHRARAYRARASARVDADNFIRSIDCDLATNEQVESAWLGAFSEAYSNTIFRNRGRR